GIKLRNQNSELRTQNSELKYVSAQVLVLYYMSQLLADILSIDHHVFLIQVGPFKRVLVQKSLHNCVQASGANVLCLFINREGELCNRVDCVFGEGEVDAFGAEQRLVLTRQRVLWLDQDSLEVFDRQRLQFDSNREAALQFGNEIRRL